MKKIFQVEENKGNVPYILIWISLDGRLRTEDCFTYEEALNKFKGLKRLKIQPGIYLNLHPDWIKPKEDLDCKNLEEVKQETIKWVKEDIGTAESPEEIKGILKSAKRLDITEEDLKK